MISNQLKTYDRERQSERERKRWHSIGLKQRVRGVRKGGSKGQGAGAALADAS